MSDEMRNVKPAVWGPAFWRTLHTIGYAYPEAPTAAQKEAVIALFQSLTQLLPCAKCRGHYTAYLSENPVQAHVDSRNALARYVYTFHEAVNGRLGKQCCDSFEQCEQKYLYGANDDCSGANATALPWVGLGVAVLAIAALAYALMRNTKKK